MSETTAADLKQDKKNANKGTARGQKMLRESLSDLGAGRSVLADKNNVLIAGNQTVREAAEMGMKTRIIETDGTELVVVKRVDLDLEKDEKARLLAYADNRVGQVNLEFNPIRVHDDLEQGLDLSSYFDKGELAELLEGLGEVPEPEEGGPKAPNQSIVRYEIIFDNAEQQERFHAFLRFLKHSYGETETHAGRIDRFLRENVGGI